MIVYCFIQFLTWHLDLADSSRGNVMKSPTGSLRGGIESWIKLEESDSLNSGSQRMSLSKGLIKAGFVGLRRNCAK